MKNNKMTKDTVPEGFSVVMALVDLLPVVFFGLSARPGGAAVSECALCHRSAHLPALRRREGALEADRGRVPQQHLAHVRSDADFHAGRLSSAAGGADRGPREAVQRGDSGRDLRLSGVCVLRAGRAGDGLHVRLCAAARFERPRANWLEQGVNALAQICIYIGLLLV